LTDIEFSSPPTTDSAGDGRQAGALPHNREAEEAVLGAVLINPEVYFDVAQLLSADDFFLVRNRWIWEAFTRLQEQRQPLDVLTVSEELERQSRLEEVGGPAYLTALINNVPSTLHAVAYAKLVDETATRRRLLEAANQIARLAYQSELDIEEVVNDSEKAVFGVSERRLAHQLQPIRQVLSEYYDRIDYLARHQDETIGVPTGFIDLDRLLGGMQPSDLLIIAGRPAQGKSGFCISAAKNAAQLHKKHVALFSLEMSNEQLVQRLVAQETGIDSQRLRLGDIDDDEWPLFTQAVSALSDTSIYLDDTPAITPLQLRTKCRRLHMEVGLDLIVVDYLQLMTGDLRSENRVQEVSYISRNLKVLARELRVPVLAAAQLSRAVEQRADKRPMLSDLRESGSLEQDADVVMFIYRPDQYETDTLKQNVAEIIVAKHRNGPTHSGIELVFRRSLAKFENAATRRPEMAGPTDRHREKGRQL
jgi:replicative DNA helicase